MATTNSPPRLQIAQVLADLSDLNVADPPAALALVTAHRHLSNPQAQRRARSKSKPDKLSQSQTSLRRRSGLTAEVPSFTPRTSVSRGDSPSSAASGSGTADGKCTPSPGFEPDPDLERAATLMYLLESRGRFKQQENGGLVRARANVEAVAERYLGMTH